MLIRVVCVIYNSTLYNTYYNCKEVPAYNTTQLTAHGITL